VSPLTWGRKQIQFPKRRVFSSNYLESERWTKSENPVFLCVQWFVSCSGATIQPLSFKGQLSAPLHKVNQEARYQLSSCKFGSWCNFNWTMKLKKTINRKNCVVSIHSSYLLGVVIGCVYCCWFSSAQSFLVRVPQTHDHIFQSHDSGSRATTGSFLFAKSWVQISTKISILIKVFRDIPQFPKVYTNLVYLKTGHGSTFAYRFKYVIYKYHSALYNIHRHKHRRIRQEDYKNNLFITVWHICSKQETKRKSIARE
jgi:hypothetical protein